jgi:hypothetical protein
VIAIILAYKRPELTLNLVTRILNIDLDLKSKKGIQCFDKILLVQDGVRITEDSKAVIDHQNVKKLCLELEKEDSRISTMLYKENIGLTQHMFRIVEEIEVNTNDCIFFEEDKVPSLEAIEFLFYSRKSMDPLCILDTLPLNEHPKMKRSNIATIFTDNGNILIGDAIFDLAKHLWVAKDSFKIDFERQLHIYLSSFLSGFSLVQAQRYYSKYLSWGLVNGDRPDSLFAYALLLSKKFRMCPSSRLSENWSDRDTRGKNVNELPSNRGLDCMCKSIEIWGFEVCPCCEKQGVSERIGLTLTAKIKNSINYRLRSTLSK